MKRKYRETQKRADEAILAAIQSGVTTNAKLKEVLRQNWMDYNVGELVDCFARTELSAAKQRLRDRGEIEITKGNEPKTIGQLSADDVGFIDERRRAHIKGEIETRVKFNHRYGRVDQAREASEQLLLFATEPDEDEVPDNMASQNA